MCTQWDERNIHVSVTRDPSLRAYEVVIECDNARTGELGQCIALICRDDGSIVGAEGQAL